MHDIAERHQRRSLRVKNYDYAQAGPISSPSVPGTGRVCLG